MTKSARLQALALVISTTFLANSTLLGATATYNADTATAGAQDGAGLGWNTSNANWWDGAANNPWPNTNIDEAIFGAGSGAAGSVTVGTVTANKLTFNSPGSGNYTLTGGTITLDGLTPTITTAVGTSPTIASVLAGSNGLTKSGPGTLSLSGVNTYTGGTVLNAGLLSTDSDSALGTGSLTLSGGTLRSISGTRTLANNVVVTAATTTNLLDNVGSGDMLLTGTVTGSGTLALNSTGSRSFWFQGNGSAFTGTINYTNVNGGTNFRLGGGVGTVSNVLTNSSDWSSATFSLSGTTASNRGMTWNGLAGATVKLGALSGVGLIGNGANAAIWEIGALNTSTTFGGQIQGTGTGLNKVGTGTLTLSDANTFTGPTTVSGGALNLTNALALQNSVLTPTTGAIVFNSSVVGNAFTIGGLNGAASGNNLVLENSANVAIALTVGNNNTTATYAGALSGTGSLIKTGTGTQTLSGANTYTGATTVNAGRLNATGSNVSAITVNSGATLVSSGTGSTTGSLTMNTGSTIALAGGATLTGFTANSVNIAGATSLTFDTLPVPGNTYKVLNYGTGLTGFANLVLPLGHNAFTDTGSAVTLAYQGTTTSTWNTTSGTWDNLVTSNWSNSIGDNKFASGDTAVFNNPSAPSTVTITGTVLPASVTINNSTNAYSFAGGAIGGSASLYKTGTGSATLSVANTLTGGITISQGSLTLGNVASAGTGTITLGDANTGANNVSLFWNPTASGSTVTNNIVVSNLSTGTVTIGTPVNTFINNTFSGTMSLNRPTILTSGSATNDRTNFTGIISGNVGLLTLTSTNNARIILGAVNTFVGDVVLSDSVRVQLGVISAATNTIPDGSNLTLGAGTQLNFSYTAGGTETINGLNGSGSIGINGATTNTLSVGSANGSGNFTGSIGGAANIAFTKLGTGTQILGGTNTYTGATTVTGGTLRVSGSITSATTVQTGATFNLTGTSTGAITVNSGAFLSGTGATTGNITLSSGSSIIASPLGSDAVRGVNVTAAASVTTYVSGTPTNAAATVDVVRYTGTAPATANFVAANFRSGSFADDTINKKITLTYTGKDLTWTPTTGGTWDLGTTFAWNAASADQFFWGDSVTFGNTAANQVVTLTGSLAPSAVAVTNANATSYTLGGAGGLVGPATLSKSGAGTLILGTTTTASTNSFSGGTTVTGGNLTVNTIITAGAKTGLGSGDVSVTNGTLQFVTAATTNAQSYGNNFLLNGATLISQDGILTYSGTVGLTGNNTFNASVAAKSATFSNVISGTGNVIVSSAGGTSAPVVFSNVNNTYTGTTSVNAGTLRITAIKNVGAAFSSLGSPTLANSVIKLGSAGTTAQLSYIGPGDTTDRVIELAGTTGGGNIDSSGTGPLKFTSALSVTGAGSKTFTLTGTNTGLNEFAGVISDNSLTNKTSFTKEATGVWLPTAINTYTGVTTIRGSLTGSNEATPLFLVSTIGNGGTPGNIGAATNAAGNIVLGSNGVSAGQITYIGLGESTDRLFTINGNAGIVNNGSGALNFTNTGSILHPSAAVHSLTLGGSYTASANTFAPVISNGTGAQAVSLVKVGASAWTLTGPNFYTGTTTINGGTLSIPAGATIYANAFNGAGAGATLSVTGGSTLELNNWHYDETVARSASLGGLRTNNFALSVNNGTIRITGTTPTTSNRGLTMAGATTLEAGAGANWTLSDPTGVNTTLVNTTNSLLTLTGAGTGEFEKILPGLNGLTKSGSGTWTLSADSTYSGITTINSGTLRLGSGGTAGSIASTSAIVNNGILATTRSNALAIGTVISGSGSLQQNGTGTTTLSAVNTYNGTTTVNAGALIVTGSLANNGIANILMAANDDTLAGNALLTRPIAAGLNTYAGFGSKVTATSLDPVLAAPLQTTAAILMSGTNAAANNLTMQWRTRTVAEAAPSNPNAVLSDVISLTEMGGDIFVLQMSYTDAVITSLNLNEGAIANSGELRLGWNNSGTWTTAVAGNDYSGGGSANFVGMTAWNTYYTTLSNVDDGSDLSSFLGAYGVDPTNNVVWAVVNHNSEFAIIPEPSTWVLGGLALLGFARVGLRRRRAV